MLRAWLLIELDVELLNVAVILIETFDLLLITHIMAVEFIHEAQCWSRNSCDRGVLHSRKVINKQSGFSGFISWFVVLFKATVWSIYKFFIEWPLINAF